MRRSKAGDECVQMGHVRLSFRCCKNGVSTVATSHKFVSFFSLRSVGTAAIQYRRRVCAADGLATV